MTFRQFAFNNVLRNKRLYVAYFLSSLFTVMVFFTFANFAFHPTLTGEDMHTSAFKGMMVAGGIIYVFSFFFILYSMSSFLQSRKKEFGVLMIQGMSNQQIRRMVFLENMLIGLLATLIGIGLGLVFAKVILLVAENVLILDENLYFYFPLKALLVTFISFVFLFFFISIFVTFVLRTNKLVKLIQGDKIGKSEPKASIWLTIIAVLFLGVGYTIALWVEGDQVVMALIPVVILVTIGTYLFFTQFSVFMIRKLKNKEGLFWKKTNMLLFSDLSFRMKDNARAFFMVAIISTVAFSAIGTLVGLNSYLTSGLKKANPISFTYLSSDSDDERDVKLIEDTLAAHDLKFEKAEVKLTYYSQENDQQVLITTPEIYNSFAKLIDEKEVSLQDNEVILKQQSIANMMPSDKELADKPIVLADGTTIKVNKELKVDPKVEVLPEIFAYYIVSDNIYEKLPKADEIVTARGWQVANGDEDQLIEAGRVINEELTMSSFMGIDYILHEVYGFYGPVMFVGLFIGIVFFVSAGSFLYFRLYTDLDDDKQKFTAISKIGLTVMEMKKVITKQIAILFFTPIVVALIHGAVALTALSHMFGYLLFKESVFVLGTFFIIQVVYFIIVRYFYMKQIRLAVQ